MLCRSVSWAQTLASRWLRSPWVAISARASKCFPECTAISPSCSTLQIRSRRGKSCRWSRTLRIPPRSEQNKTMQITNGSSARTPQSHYARDLRQLPRKTESGRTTMGARADSCNLLAIIGVVGLLSSCTVGPNYVRPQAETPVAYKELDGWKTAQPQDAVIRGKWWELYNDTQLNDYASQIETANQSLAAAQ